MPSANESESLRSSAVVKAMLATLQEAGITRPAGRLALWLGGTVASSVIGGALLNLIHKTPIWLLIPFCIALLVMAWGAIVLVATKRLSARPLPVAPDGPPQKRLGEENGDFAVVIEDDEHVPFDYIALFVKVRLRLVNRSPKTKHAMGIHLTSDGWMLVIGNRDVDQERLRLEHDLPKPARGPLKPGEERVLWIVTPFAWRPGGGEPGYTVTFKDEVGHEYGVARLARPARTVGDAG